MNISALRYRDFQLYFLGNIIALNGLWMQRMTVAWIGWELTGSTGFLGLVTFLTVLPSLILGPLFGALTDQANVKRAALITISLNIVVSLIFFTAFRLGLTTAFVICFYALTLGLLDSAYNPIRLSLAPRLVPREKIASVVALTAVNFNVARTSGPALAGILIGTIGVGSTLAVQSAAYLPFLVCLSCLSVRPARGRGQKKQPFWESFRDGLNWVFTRPLIRHLLVLTFIMAFVTRGVLELLPGTADGIFRRGADGTGLMISLAGGGAFLAGLTKLIATPKPQSRISLPLWLSVLAGLIAVSLFGLSTNWTLSLSLAALMGFTSTYAAISFQTLMQTSLEDEMRGRVMSLWIVVGIGAAALGAVSLGGLSDLLGTKLSFTGAGFLSLFPLLWVLHRHAAAGKAAPV